MEVTRRIGGPNGSRAKKLDTGVLLDVPVTAVFTSAALRVTIEVDVADGVPVCPRYTVERVDGGGLESVTTEVLAGVPLRGLMANACARAVVEPIEGGHVVRAAISLEAIEAVVGPLKRTRRPITDATLMAFANAYEERFQPGHMRQFAESLHYSERQAWRLKKRAEQRGFLPGKKPTGERAEPTQEQIMNLLHRLGPGGGDDGQR